MEWVAAPAHMVATRTNDGCQAILPVSAASVTNPATNIGPWQWVVMVAANAMEGGSGKANSDGRETGACVAVDC
jgi:hypothetical protein